MVGAGPVGAKPSKGFSPKPLLPTCSLPRVAIPWSCLSRDWTAHFCPSLNSICASLLSRISTRPDSAASRFGLVRLHLAAPQDLTRRERFEPAQSACATCKPNCWVSRSSIASRYPFSFIVHLHLLAPPGGGGFAGDLLTSLFRQHRSPLGNFLLPASPANLGEVLADCFRRTFTSHL